MNNSRIAAALWFLSVVAFVLATVRSRPSQGELLLGSIVFGLLMGLYMMFSDVRMAVLLIPLGKVVPAAMVHLAVDWMWSVMFAG